jgi:enoyl-CoA hydratase/carnithine racemase
MSDLVLFERRGSTALLTLNRPDARNAISPEVSQAMAALLDEIEADAALRAVVLTGAGEVFSAGADLKVVAQGRGMEIARGKGGFAGVTTRDFPKPLIAAVNGYALGGGLELCLSCDLIIAEEHATFGLPEVKLGFIAAAGGVSRLSRRVPLVIASEIALTGDPVDAHFALRAGLINAVVPKGEGLGEALALARRICRGAPLAVQMSKAALRTSISAGEDDVIANVDPELFRRFRESADLAEGPRAFAEKREPQWTGR